MKSNILKDALEVKCFSFMIQKPCMICFPEPDCQMIREGDIAWEEVITEMDKVKEEPSWLLLRGRPPKWRKDTQFLLEI